MEFGCEWLACHRARADSRSNLGSTTTCTGDVERDLTRAITDLCLHHEERVRIHTALKMGERR